MADQDERSPLLGRPLNTPDHLENRNGLVGGDSNERDDEERQGDGGREAQYEGLPEVKKKLKFIVPAVAIGASHALC